MKTPKCHVQTCFLLQVTNQGNKKGPLISKVNNTIWKNVLSFLWCHEASRRMRGKIKTDTDWDRWTDKEAESCSAELATRKASPRLLLPQPRAEVTGCR
jgi:hypothetical protein